MTVSDLGNTNNLFSLEAKKFVYNTCTQHPSRSMTKALILIVCDLLKKNIIFIQILLEI